MLTETVAGFALTSFVIELTPGPNMVYLTVLSVAHGRRAGYAATAGIALGLLIVGLGAAFGLATLISESPFLYGVLRWSGVAYMFWLAWAGWKDAVETSPAQTTDARIKPRDFLNGLTVNLLNPKAAFFYVAILPTFVDAARPVLEQTVVLSIVYVLVATLVHGSIVTAAATARPFLENTGRSRLVRRGLSLVLALVAVWFGYATAR